MTRNTLMPLLATILALASFQARAADAASRASTAIRHNVVYSATGRGRIAMQPGRYRVYASRGIEWSLDTASLLISAEVERKYRPRLRREVDSTGFIAADLHIHTAEHSGHGDASVAEQVMALAGEGVEFAVATEHPLDSAVAAAVRPSRSCNTSAAR